MSAILECRGLTKAYHSVPALNAVNLEINAGKITGLLGPNGSGKTTLIKLAAGLLSPTIGEILINGMKPGPETKAIVSYLPERTYFDKGMKISELMGYFEDFYEDFDRTRAEKMLSDLSVDRNARLKTLSKGTQEKAQLVMVMSRRAKLYMLDEPIGGVDPAARDYILKTIISNYDSDASIVISTHLISDIEKVLDDFVFIRNGEITMSGSVDDIRESRGVSLDELFREVFKC